MYVCMFVSMYVFTQFFCVCAKIIMLMVFFVFYM